MRHPLCFLRAIWRTLKYWRIGPRIKHGHQYVISKDPSPPNVILLECSVCGSLHIAWSMDQNVVDFNKAAFGDKPMMAETEIFGKAKLIDARNIARSAALLLIDTGGLSWIPHPYCLLRSIWLFFRFETVAFSHNYEISDIETPDNVLIETCAVCGRPRTAWCWGKFNKETGVAM